MKMDPFGGLVSPSVERHRAERSAQASKPKYVPKKPRQLRVNPWGLTAGQCEVMDAVTETGCGELAAAKLGLSAKTVSEQMARAKSRMGIDLRLMAVLVYDRWSREHQETKAETVLFDGTAPGGDLQVSEKQGAKAWR